MALKPLRIRDRLIGCIIGTLTLLLLLALFLQFSLKSVVRYQPEMAARDRFLQRVNATASAVEIANASLAAYLASGDPSALALFSRKRFEIRTALTDPKTIREAEFYGSAFEPRRRKLIDDWETRVVGPALAANPGSQARAKKVLEEGGALADEISNVTGEIDRSVISQLEGSFSEQRQEARDNLLVLWIAFGVVSAITLFIQQAVARSIVGPLKKLADAARRLQKGDAAARVDIRTGDELQNMAEAFNAMADAIAVHQRELEERVSEKTAELQATLLAAESERLKLQTIIHRIPDGLLLVDADGVVVDANDAALATLGHTDLPSLQDRVNHLPGSFALRRINQQSLSLDDFPFFRAGRGENFSNESFYLRGADHQTRLVSFSGGPVLTRAGRTILGVCIFRDVTRELALRQELEEKNLKLADASRAKDEFLAMLSHELRTPLTPILANAELLLADDLAFPQSREVELIRRNAQALSAMFDELLDLSAITYGKMRLRLEQIELNEWVCAVLDNVRPAWQKKDQTLTFTGLSHPLQIRIDAARLGQVVTNLVSNAVKYTDVGGRIEVAVSESEDKFSIRVKDNGAGLSSGDMSAIFEMFHQAASNHVRKAGGLGVGLSVARSIARLHGGVIQVESEGLGRGSAFTLVAPRRTSDRAGALPASVPAQAQPPTQLLRGRRILLVEDSEDTLETLKRILLRRECQVETARTAEDGLRLAESNPPEIVISDVGLPGMDGLEFIRQLRRSPRHAGLMAVALSGLGRDQDAHGALEAGFDAHLLKPIEMQALDSTLLGLLERNKTR